MTFDYLPRDTTHFGYLPRDTMIFGYSTRDIITCICVPCDTMNFDY